MSYLNVITTHFNTEENFIDFPSFVEAVLCIQNIANDFKKHYFPSLEDVTIEILPPEPGSFKLKTALKIGGYSLGTLWGATQVLDSDVVKAYIKGLTGNEPAYYAEIAGKSTRNAFVNTQDEYKAETLLITDVTKGFIEAPNAQLGIIGFPSDEFCQALEAKNKFFNMCKNNQSIKSVGFDASDDYSIQKENMNEYLANIPTNSVSQEENFNVNNFIIDNNAQITITSPDWLNNRKWKIIYNNKAYTMQIIDDNFWAIIEANGLHTKIMDNMHVQLAFIQEGKIIKNLLGIKVLSFNGETIGTSLPILDARSKIDEALNKKEANNNQILFDFDEHDE